MLRRHHIRVDVPARSIDLQVADLADIPTGPRYYVRQLIRMGFTLQTTLF